MSHEDRILEAIKAGCTSQETICEYAGMAQRTLLKERKKNKTVDTALKNLNNKCSEAYCKKLKEKVKKVKHLVAGGKSIRSSCLMLKINMRIYYKYKDLV